MEHGGGPGNVFSQAQGTGGAGAGDRGLVGADSEITGDGRKRMGLIDSDMDDLKYEIADEVRNGTRIKVIGVGGGGCNAVARMVAEGVDGVQFYAMNTDLQALSACQVPNKLQLGAKMTGGLGAGANAEIGRQAALENTDM